MSVALPLHDATDLVRLARATPWFARAMRAAHSLALADWAIGASAIRNLPWDALQHRAEPSLPADIDFVHFDAGADAPTDAALLQRLQALEPELPWEATNQANVHRWFAAQFGHDVSPLGSLTEAVASWPEYATCVALTIDADGAWRVIAPYGLDDLFGRIVRRNPVRASVATYRQRIVEKRYAERWPAVRVVAE